MDDEPVGLAKEGAFEAYEAATMKLIMRAQELMNCTSPQSTESAESQEVGVGEEEAKVQTPPPPPAAIAPSPMQPVTVPSVDSDRELSTDMTGLFAKFDNWLTSSPVEANETLPLMNKLLPDHSHSDTPQGTEPQTIPDEQHHHHHDQHHDPPNPIHDLDDFGSVCNDSANDFNPPDEKEISAISEKEVVSVEQPPPPPPPRASPPPSEPSRSPSIDTDLLAATAASLKRDPPIRPSGSDREQLLAKLKAQEAEIERLTKHQYGNVGSSTKRPNSLDELLTDRKKKHWSGSKKRSSVSPARSRATTESREGSVQGTAFGKSARSTVPRERPVQDMKKPRPPVRSSSSPKKSTPPSHPSHTSTPTKRERQPAAFSPLGGYTNSPYARKQKHKNTPHTPDHQSAAAWTQRGSVNTPQSPYGMTPKADQNIDTTLQPQEALNYESEALRQMEIAEKKSQITARYKSDMADISRKMIEVADQIHEERQELKAISRRKDVQMSSCESSPEELETQRVLDELRQQRTEIHAQYQHSLVLVAKMKRAAKNRHQEGTTRRREQIMLSIKQKELSIKKLEDEAARCTEGRDNATARANRERLEWLGDRYPLEVELAYLIIQKGEQKEHSPGKPSVQSKASSGQLEQLQSEIRLRSSELRHRLAAEQNWMSVLRGRDRISCQEIRHYCKVFRDKSHSCVPTDVKPTSEQIKSQIELACTAELLEAWLDESDPSYLDNDELLYEKVTDFLEALMTESEVLNYQLQRQMQDADTRVAIQNTTANEHDFDSQISFLRAQLETQDHAPADLKEFPIHDWRAPLLLGDFNSRQLFITHLMKAVLEQESEQKKQRHSPADAAAAHQALEQAKRELASLLIEKDRVGGHHSEEDPTTDSDIGGNGNSLKLQRQMLENLDEEISRSEASLANCQRKREDAHHAAITAINRKLSVKKSEVSRLLKKEKLLEQQMCDLRSQQTAKLASVTKSPEYRKVQYQPGESSTGYAAIHRHHTSPQKYVAPLGTVTPQFKNIQQQGQKRTPTTRERAESPFAKPGRKRRHSGIRTPVQKGLTPPAATTGMGADTSGTYLTDPHHSVLFSDDVGESVDEYPSEIQLFGPTSPFIPITEAISELEKISHLVHEGSTTWKKVKGGGYGKKTIRLAADLSRIEIRRDGKKVAEDFLRADHIVRVGKMKPTSDHPPGQFPIFVQMRDARTEFVFEDPHTASDWGTVLSTLVKNRTSLFFLKYNMRRLLR